MGFWDRLLGSIDKTSDLANTLGAIDYGNQKIDDSHEHRYNKGSDRTPAQKNGDKKKKKPKV